VTATNMPPYFCALRHPDMSCPVQESHFYPRDMNGVKENDLGLRLNSRLL